MPIDPSIIMLITFPLAFAIIIVGLYYINKKYPEKERKLDPILKSVLIVGGFLSIFIIAVATGVIEKEWLQQNLKWFIIALILLIAFYTYVAYRLRRPIPFNKRFRIALSDADEYYKGKPVLDMAHFPTILYHNVFEGKLPEKTGRELQIELMTGTVDVFLLELKSNVVFSLLIVLNVFTGENIKMVYNPSYSLQEELLGKEAVSVYKEFKEEFEEKEEEQQEQK